MLALKSIKCHCTNNNALDCFSMCTYSGFYSRAVSEITCPSERQKRNQNVKSFYSFVLTSGLGMRIWCILSYRATHQINLPGIGHGSKCRQKLINKSFKLYDECLQRLNKCSLIGNTPQIGIFCRSEQATRWLKL